LRLIFTNPKYFFILKVFGEAVASAKQRLFIIMLKTVSTDISVLSTSWSKER